MFGIKKKKIKLSNEELRIMRYSLIDFRNQLLRENKYADVANDVIVKLKNKMKVDRYDLVAMINSLQRSRKNKNQDTLDIDNLLLKLLDVYEGLKVK